MSRGNRNMAAKHDKAKRERSAWAYGEMLKGVLTESRLTDGEALVAAIARREDTIAIGGRVIRKVKAGVTGQNVAKRQPDARIPSVISAHW